MQTKSFCRLFSLRPTPERYAKRLSDLLQLEQEIGGLPQEAESESKKPSKISRTSSHQRASSLALDLWTEIERHSVGEMGQASISAPDRGLAVSDGWIILQKLHNKLA